METLQRHFVEKNHGDEELLKRVGGLETKSQAHQNMMIEIEKAALDRAEEFEMELEDYRKANKEDLRSIRKYIQLCMFCFTLLGMAPTLSHKLFFISG